MLDYNYFINSPLNEAKLHKLAGIAMIMNDRLLLVYPKKFKKKDYKWSIPKGHIDIGDSKKETALKELEEETGIKMTKKELNDRLVKKISFHYKKTSGWKELTVYFVNVEHEFVEPYMKNVMIKKKMHKGNEIKSAGFFDKDEVGNLIEIGQYGILRFI